MSEADNINGILANLDMTHGFDINHERTYIARCGEILSQGDTTANCVPEEWCGRMKDIGGESVTISCLNSVRSFILGS